MCGSGVMGVAGQPVQKYTGYGTGVMGAAGAAAPAPAQYVAQTATQTGVAGAHGHGAGSAPDQAGHEGHGHGSILYNLKPSIPTQGQFIKGSLGADAGTDFKLEKGVGFKGKKGRDPNGGDQSQNNLKKADANRPAYGIPSKVAGTNTKPNYVQDIQVSIGMGALEALRPDVLQSLIDAQNAGKGSVWNGVAYLTGLIDQHDGSVSPALEQARSEIMQTKVGQSGKSIAQWAENPKDQNGTNWARSNHAMTGVKAYLQLEAAGVPTKAALDVANNDDLVSGAGRIDWIKPGRASNNQENTYTGMNGAERKEWAKAAEYARELGKPEILRIMMDSHTMGSHMLTQFGNNGAASKIDKNLGLDKNMTVEQRKQSLVNYFLNNPKDPKKGEEAKGGGAEKKAVDQSPPPATTEAPGEVAGAGGGCGGGMPGQTGVGGAEGGKDSVGQLSGGGPLDTGSIAAVLAQLVDSLNKLIQALNTSGVGGVSGGGAPGKIPAQTTPAIPAAPTTPAPAAAHATTAHAH